MSKHPTCFSLARLLCACRLAAVCAAAIVAASPSAHAADATRDCFTTVKRILVDHLGVEAAKVVPPASIVDDLGADDLDTIEIVMATEEEFAVEIPDQDAGKLVTVADLTAYLARRGVCKAR
jgi:acyl carrier protein